MRSVVTHHLIAAISIYFLLLISYIRIENHKFNNIYVLEFYHSGWFWFLYNHGCQKVTKGAIKGTWVEFKPPSRPGVKYPQ